MTNTNSNTNAPKTHAAESLNNKDLARSSAALYHLAMTALSNPELAEKALLRIVGDAEQMAGYFESQLEKPMLKELWVDLPAVIEADLKNEAEA